MAGSVEHHEKTIADLSALLEYVELNISKFSESKKKALEVLAGCGRNVTVIKKYFPFNRIELLEGCKEYIKPCLDTGVSKVHHKFLH